LIPTEGNTSGQVELYRIYDSEQDKPQMVRSSSRTSKPPVHLSEDNPTAIQQRIYEKCVSIYKIIKEKDALTGNYFAQPVDPVALGIPNYYSIITNPMDLSTLEKELDKKPFNAFEFEKNMRLIFENAMKYNEDTTHAVHMAARNLLTLFCMKFKDVERDLHKIEKKVEDPVAIKVKKPIISRGKELPTTSSKKENNSIINKRKRLPDDKKRREYVTRAEFDALKQQMKTMQNMLESLMKSNGVHHDIKTPSKPIEKPVRNSFAEKPITPPVEKISPPKYKPLTLEEQEILTESINSIAPDKLPGVIQIIRESTKLNGDEEEIDLEIDQLDTATQRKLQRYVLMNVKENKRKKGVEKKKKAPKPAEKPVEKVVERTTTAPANNASSSKENTSFFGFKSLNEDSDDDSSASSQPIPTKKVKSAESSSFLPDDPKESYSSSDDSDDEDFKADNTKASSTNWNKITKTPPAQNDSPGNKSTSSSSSSEDPMWASARNQSQKNSSLEHMRATQKQKLLQSTTQKQQENYIQSTTTLKKLSEEKAAQQKFENEKKQQEVSDMRKQMRQSYENVEATVDLEEQRNIMKKYESSLVSGDYEFGGSNSPSSDFGF